MRLLENENVLRKRLTMLQSIYKFLFNLCSSPQLPKNKDVDGILSHEEITAGLWSAINPCCSFPGFWWCSPQMSEWIVREDAFDWEVTWRESFNVHRYIKLMERVRQYHLPKVTFPLAIQRQGNWSNTIPVSPLRKYRSPCSWMWGLRHQTQSKSLYLPWWRCDPVSSRVPAPVSYRLLHRG